MRPQTLYDLATIDLDKPIFTIDDIRQVNPQRHEMEQLTAILHVDRATDTIIGYKDVTNQEFWVRGHMPEFALMPGVILCECAAQLAGFYARKYELLGGEFLGFGGMNDVRFRSPVFPGCRLIIMAQLKQIRGRRRAEFEFQGLVGDRLVLNGTMIGVPIDRNQPPPDAGRD